MMADKTKIGFFLGMVTLAVAMSLSGCAGTQPRTEEAPKPIPEDDVFTLLAKGENAKAKEFFKGRADINGLDEKGRTPLHIAVERKDPELIVFLLSNGARVDAKNAEGKTALKIAYEAEDSASSKALAEAGADIFFTDTEGTNASRTLFARKRLLVHILNLKNINSLDGSGKSLLHFAAIDSDKEAVKLLLEKAADPNLKDAKDNTPLDYAFAAPMSLEHIRVAELLVQAGGRSQTETVAYCVPAIKTSNFDIRFEDGLAPLHFAAREGHLGVIKYLLEKKAKPDAKNASGATPLQEAFRMGKLEAAALLIQAGANVNAKDAKGNSAMHLVMPQGVRLAGLELLLASKADPNIKDDHGDSPLHVAVGTNLGIDVVRMLIANSANPNIRNSEGMTPLHTAVDRSRIDSIYVLISNGADVFAADLKGRTPFDLALQKGDALLQAVITAATVGATDKEGNTQLHTAIIRKAEVRTIALLLDRKAGVNVRNMNGDTPLHLAVQADLREIGELLIARGADIFASNSSGKSPFFLAAAAPEGFKSWMLNSTTVEAKDGLGNGIVHYAASWPRDTLIPSLIRAGARVDAQNATGETPLFAAIKADSPPTIAVLLAEGATPLARDSLGNTALHAAVRWNAKKAVDALIKGGADINAGNLNGKTPLHEAVRLGMAETEGMLLAAGAALEARDLSGNTPLMDAVQNGLNTSIERLLEKGASLNVRNNAGDTPLHVAVNTARMDIATALLSKGASIHAKNAKGITPLRAALRKGAVEAGTLLTKDRINETDNDGATPLHIAVQEKAQSAVIAGILAFGPKLSEPDAGGKTPLHIALNERRYDTAKQLVDAGADPFVFTGAEETAAALAIRLGKDALFAVFSGSAVSGRDAIGNTVLHYAAGQASSDIIQQLLELGASKTAKNVSGELPVDLAYRWQREKNEKLLRP